MKAIAGKPRRLLLRSALILPVAIPFLTMGAARRVEPRVAPTTAATTLPAAEPPELTRLEPGTRFRDDAPPAGWSVVAFKSIPVLATGAVGTLSPEAHATARRIRLVILADAEGSRLRRVGVGLSAPVVGEGPDAGDVIVEATHVGDLSGEWSAKERIILGAASRELGRATLAAATPTFALLRMPTTCVVGAEHETADVSYALLVEPGSNRLRFLACKPAVADAPAVVRELKTPAIVESPLHVKATTFAGFPVAWSFAMIDIPKGDEREVPAELAELLAPDSPTTTAIRPDDAETAFRSLARRSTPGPTARADGRAQGD